MSDFEKGAGITDAQIEWREQVGQRLMLAMTCQHGSDYFGSGAVCETCFANVQRIGHLIERIATQAWDQGRAAERRDWELTVDLSTADDDRRSLPNPYRVLPPPPTPCATCTDPAELTDCRSDTGEQCGPCHVASCAECQDVMADEDAASARTDGRAP